MKWLVMDVIPLYTQGRYILSLQSSSLKMMAEVISVLPVQIGDYLYPVRDAIYLINQSESHSLKVHSASAFSDTRWRLLNRLPENNTHII